MRLLFVELTLNRTGFNEWQWVVKAPEFNKSKDCYVPDAEVKG
jgi:hypothetical protein